MLGGICPSSLMSCMYCTFDVFYIYIYIRLLFGIACLAYHTAIKFALYQLLYPECNVIVSTSNELQPYLRNLLAHSMANINIFMKCYIMFCVANLRKNLMTLFTIYHRHYLSSIIVDLLHLRHVYHIRMLLIC